jgi:hypothetical protein
MGPCEAQQQVGQQQPNIPAAAVSVAAFKSWQPQQPKPAATCSSTTTAAKQQDTVWDKRCVRLHLS